METNSRMRKETLSGRSMMRQSRCSCFTTFSALVRDLSISSSASTGLALPVESKSISSELPPFLYPSVEGGRGQVDRLHEEGVEGDADEDRQEGDEKDPPSAVDDVQVVLEVDLFQRVLIERRHVLGIVHFK